MNHFCEEKNINEEQKLLKKNMMYFFCKETNFVNKLFGDAKILLFLKYCGEISVVIK